MGFSVIVLQTSLFAEFIFYFFVVLRRLLFFPSFLPMAEKQTSLKSERGKRLYQGDQGCIYSFDGQGTDSPNNLPFIFLFP